METRMENDGIIVSSADFPGRDSGNWSVNRETLHGGLQEGVELIHIDNGRLKFSVIPTRGMSVFRVECGECSLGWNSPVKQIVHPQFVDLNDHGGLGWLSGFNEMMVRCGVAFAGHPGEDNGTMLTLHGRIGNIPASDVAVVVDEETPWTIRVHGKVEEKMFKFGLFELWTEVSTTPGDPTIRFRDRLVNKSEYEQEYQLIYHANYGRPILEKDARFVAPIRKVSPLDDYAAQDISSFQTYLGPTRGYGEQVYCLELNADRNESTTVMLHNAAGESGVAMTYDTRTLPHFTLWKNTDTETDGYVTGLEPATGYPFNRSVEREAGRVPKLEPGGEVVFDVEVRVLENAESVNATRAQIEQIQANQTPEISSTPPKP